MIRTHMGACELPDGPPGEVRGYWQDATCAEFSEAIAAHGGRDNLSVWSSFTDLDGQYGNPYIFTCWGQKTADGNPVAADGGHPDHRWKGDEHPCVMAHAVFVPASELRSERDGSHS